MPNDPDYDPRTLYVPTDFLNNQTPVGKILVLNTLLFINIDYLF